MKYFLNCLEIPEFKIKNYIFIIFINLYVNMKVYKSKSLMSEYMKNKYTLEKL